MCRCLSICIMWLDGWKRRMIESWATSTRALSKSASAFLHQELVSSVKDNSSSAFQPFEVIDHQMCQMCFTVCLFFLWCCLHFHRKPLVSCVEKQLLGEHMTAILQKGEWSTVPVIWLGALVFFVLFERGFLYAAALWLEVNPSWWKPAGACGVYH